MNKPETLELIEYMKANLKIEINQEDDDSYGTNVVVKLKLNDEVISESSTIIWFPSRNNFEEI